MEDRTYQFKSGNYRWLGYGAMTALWVLSMLFFKERAWLLDIAYQTFLMIQEGTVQVMVYRFGAAIIQSLPLAGIYLGAPLWFVSFLYSISFTLLYGLFYWLIVRVFKNDYLGMVLVFTFTLLVFDSFYWATSEQIQGLGALLVFYAYLLKYPQAKGWRHWLFLVIGVTALAYYHPLIFIPFYFLWFFMLLDQPKVFGQQNHIILAGLMLVVQGIKYVLSANWYDSVKYNNFYSNFQTYQAKLWAIPSHLKFGQWMLEVWYWFPIVLIIVSVFYIWKKQWLKLALIFGFCVGYLLLIHIGDTEAPYRFYAEVNYLALMIFVGVPLVFDVLPAFQRYRVIFVGVALVVASRIVIIGAHHTPYTNRIEWIQAYLAQQPDASSQSKFLLEKSKAPQELLMMNWGLPFESLIISAVNGPEHSQTLYIPDSHSKYQKALDAEGQFFSDFRSWKEEGLNPAYFKLDGRYKEVDY